MKTAVSIPDPVFEDAEKLAERLGMSRSELYSKALATMIHQHRDNVITARLNEVYGSGSEQSSLDPEFARVQSRSLPPEKW